MNTTAEVKEFSTTSVLTLLTGFLLTDDIQDMVSLMEWMTDGEELYAHQFPRVSDEALPVILGIHPTLQEAIDESKGLTEDNFHEWINKWNERYGMTITVPKFLEGQHRKLDPMSELIELIEFVNKGSNNFVPVGEEETYSTD